MMLALQAWLAQRLRRERWRFTRDAVVLLAGNGVASVLFLLFHMVAGRRMPGTGYAELVAMIGLLNVLSVPAGVMQLTMALFVAERREEASDGTWLFLVRLGLRGVTRWGLMALAVWCLFAPLLRSALQTTMTANVLMVGLIAFIFLYTPILNGALQGSHRFGWFAASGMGVGLSRLFLLLPVLWLGGSVAGVLGVVATSFGVGLVIAYWPMRRISPAPQAVALPPATEVHRYFWGVLVAQVGLYLLLQADVIFSTRLFEGEILAAYGKVATMSRIVFFLPLPIIIAMFPRAVVSRNPNVLWVPLGATLLLTSVVAAFFSLFPDIFMGVMYGRSDELHDALVKRYVWAALPMAVISVLSPYIWARRAVWSALLILPVTGVYVFRLWSGVATPEALIQSMLVAGLVALTILVWITFRVLRADAAEERRPVTNARPTEDRKPDAQPSSPNAQGRLKP